MRRTRKVKILATLGPASSDKAVIERLFNAGADVFRINMSHTDHDMLRRLVTTIREVETETGRPIGVLVDLQGPKLRIGAFADRTMAWRPARPSSSIPTRRRATPRGSSCRIRKFWQRCGRAIACSSTTARCVSASSPAAQERP